MSVRVNLLPREAEERERGRRAMAGLAVAGLVLVAILVGLFFLQESRVGDAEERLAEAETELGELQAEANELNAYAQLAERRDQALEILKATMAGDVTYAGILQDVAAVMPNEAALTNLSVATQTDPQQPEDFDLGGPSYGTISGSGDTLRGHAPGVERFIIEFDKIAAFFNVFVSSSTVDDVEGIEVTAFNFEANLGPEIFTARYIDGLPEALR